jgi:hypothetical protein
MAVVVVQADADDPQLRVHRRQERGIGVGRPVMGDLEHVSAQVRPGLEQPLLGLDLRVAGKQDPHAVDDGTQHE